MRPIVDSNYATMQHRSRLLRALQCETPWVVEHLRDAVLPGFTALPDDWALNDWFRAVAVTPTTRRGPEWRPPQSVFADEAERWQSPLDSVDRWFDAFALLEVDWLRQHLLVVLKYWTENPDLAANAHWEGRCAEAAIEDHKVLPLDPAAAPQEYREAWAREVAEQRRSGDHDAPFRWYRWAALYIAGSNDDGSFGWTWEKISNREANTTNLSAVRSAVLPILQACELEPRD